MSNEDTQWEAEWLERQRVYSEDQLHDPISLHTQACLGYTTKVPNLTHGGLDSIIFYDFAHMVEPPISCPHCGTTSEPKKNGVHSDDSLVFLSASRQCSYLCTECWQHNLIPAFGIYNPEDKT